MREGETYAATKTSSNNTPESFIVGVGASGALLAGAAVIFVTLVGLVSFNVWPTASNVSLDGNVELSAPTPSGSSSPGAAAPVSTAAGQVASTSTGTGTGTGAGGGAVGGNGQGNGGGKVGHPKGGVTVPPSATPTPPLTDTGDSGGSDTNAPPGSASKSPAHPVHPSHPDMPHQNISDGTNGSDDAGSGNGSDDVVTGKGPFGKPETQSSPPSRNADTETIGTPKGHGSAKLKH